MQVEISGTMSFEKDSTLPGISMEVENDWFGFNRGKWPNPGQGPSVHFLIQGSVVISMSSGLLSLSLYSPFPLTTKSVDKTPTKSGRGDATHPLQEMLKKKSLHFTPYFTS